MIKWKPWIISGLMAVILIAAVFWGYREYQDRQRLQNRAESQYQKSFHELSWHMDTITGQLAQLVVGASKEQATLGLATLWRQVFAAQANIGSLPLAFVPFSQSEKLLADVADVSYTLLNRVALSREGLQEKDFKVIREMYDRAKILKDDLGTLGAKVLNRELSWTQVEMAAFSTGDKPEDNTILDGFDLMEKKMEEYPELNLGEDFTAVRPDIKQVKGNQEIGLEQAQTIARTWWFGRGDQHKVRLNYEGVGDIPTYGLEFSPLEGETSPAYVDVSKLDGTVIWGMKARAIGAQELDLSAGERKAADFLEKHDLGPVSPVNVETGDTAGVYTFVPCQGDVLLYPDQMKVQVALDNGEILGYEGTPYYMFHKTRDLPAPQISEEQLRRQISPYLNVEQVRPALIANTWGEEILTWEVRGTFAEEKFVIFYNAANGSEEQIVRITPPPEYEFNTAA